MATPSNLPTTPFELGLPSNERGIGKLILSPDSESLIQGVTVTPFSLWPDDRGYFLEVLRIGGKHGTIGDNVQVSAAVGYAGIIKAFHYHMHQTDFWMPVQGMLQVALVDLRKESPTFGQRNTLYVGTLRPWRIQIPPGVGHGYKVIGQDPALLVYVTDQFYNPADEGRIPYDNPGIHYDWTLQHK